MDRGSVDGASESDEATAGPSWLTRPFPRRRFLQAAGAAGAAAAVWTEMPWAFGAINNVSPDYALLLRRREDALHLGFRFFNLRKVDRSLRSPVLERIDSARPAYVVVDFEPQSALEEAWLETEANPPPRPLGRRGSGASRLAFLVPTTIAEIPLTVDALLDWDQWTPSVPPSANPAANPVLRPPADIQTAIELPWWLILAPRTGSGRWDHSRVRPEGSRVPLWQTRFTSRLDARFMPTTPLVHAVWTRDFDNDSSLKTAETSAIPPKNLITTGQPWPATLSIRDRVDIVRVTSDPNLAPPKPAILHKLQLSSMGGTLDVEGRWTVFDRIQKWMHQSTLGRDHFVEVIYGGYLMPFGHRAVEVTISERRIEQTTGAPVAFIRKRTFLVLEERTRNYGDAYARPYDCRDMPFRTLEVTTRATPPISQGQLGAISTGRAYIPIAGGGAYRFSVIGRDWAGRSHQFTVPMVFVFEGAATTAGETPQIVAAYNAQTDLRRANLGGQKVHFAPSTREDDTAFETGDIFFAANNPTVTVADTEFRRRFQPRYYPKMENARLRLEAAETISGGPVQNTAAENPAFSIASQFVTAGFQELKDGVNNYVNAGQVYLQKAKDEAAAALAAPVETTGALIAPYLGIDGISKHLGPFGGDIAKLASGTFDPKQFFKGAFPKLLGSIDLASLLQPLTKFPGQLPKAMKITTNRVGAVVTTTMDWHPDLGDDPILKVFTASVRPKPSDSPIPATLDLHGRFVADAQHPENSTYEITGDLRNFTLNLLGTGPLRVLELQFNRLAFRSASGEKADLDVDIRNTKFHGPLEYIAKLQKFLKSNGIRVDVAGSGIRADADIALPNIGLGALTIKNVKIAVGLSIPFDGKPVRANFAFSSREDPFVLTVSLFGGGGFIGMRVGGERIEMFEASLEFGASVSLDFGVASGSITVMGGVYFKLEAMKDDTGKTYDSVQLTAYIRLTGELDVLGVVTVTIEFYLELSFVSGGPGQAGRLFGRGTLTIEVDVTLYSDTVEITVERTFAGSAPVADDGAGSGSAAGAGGAEQGATSEQGALGTGGVPIRSFFDLVPELSDWAAYCAAQV